MHIQIEETRLRIAPEEGDDTHLLNIILNNVATYMNKNYLYKRREMIKKAKASNNSYLINKYSKWDGRELLYTSHDWGYSVNVGLLFSLLRTFTLFKMRYVVEDLRGSPVEASPIIHENDAIELYDYQQEIIDNIDKYGGCGIISAPTGSGKTMVGTEIASMFHTPAIVIASKVLILKEWVKTFKTKRMSNLTWKKIKSVWIGYIDEEPRVMLCTNLFLSPYYKYNKSTHKDISYIADNCGLLIYDEVHGGGSDTGIDILDYCQARYRFGLSGTPLMRTDGKDMEYVSRIGGLLAHIPEKVVMDRGKIVPVDVYFKPVRRVGTRRLKYKEAELQCIVMNKERNEKILESILDFVNKDMKFMIFVDKIVHAQEINALSGIDYTDASDPDKDEKFDKLQSGEIMGLICTYQLAGVGFDLPSLDALIFAGAGYAATKILQARGRVIRAFEEKERGIIIDFADTSKYFDDHAYERYKLYNSRRGIHVHAKGTWLHRK